MNFLSAADRLSAIDRKAIVFNPDRCLHAMDKYAECEACYQVCPVGAITSGKPPSLYKEACKTCLACLPVCPTGAYLAEDAVLALTKAALRLETDAVELACEAHPDIILGLTEASVCIRVRGCLAGLGSSAYLTLFATKKEQVSVRLDACQDCPWGKLQAQVLTQIQEAKKILNRWELSNQLEPVLNVTEKELHERPVWEADNPPLSRRELFTFATQRSQLLAARAMYPESGLKAEQRPGANRLRMAAVISQFPQSEFDIQDLSGLAVISVSNECTACGACERTCPTNAIDFSQHEFKTFELKFEPAKCIGCEICMQVCVPDAITINHKPSFQAVFGQTQPVVLMEGEITRCERCNVIMAVKPGVFLCPICQYRRENPFGGPLPPKLMHLLQSQSKGKTSS
jgi:ferredoxin